jgi:hypothetical protein
MLAERWFRLLINAGYVAVLYKILLQDDCEYLDWRVGGDKESPHYFFNYPCQKIPEGLDSFYVFKIAYHLFEQIYSLIYQRNRADFLEYFLHHFMTITLVAFSYSMNFMPVGSVVMLLHDVTDAGMSICKVTADVAPIVI